MEQAIDKVRRLLRLAKSDNPHEAALAASKAQEIIDRHKLDPKLFVERKEEPIADLGSLGPARDGWACSLAVHVAGANGCRVYRNGGFLRLVGQPSSEAGVRAVFDWLRSEVDRQAKAHSNGQGRTWANNFRIGMVQTIGERLREQREATENAVRSEAAPEQRATVEAAIVLSRNSGAAVQAWMDSKLKLRKGPARRVRYDGGAREAGQRAGRAVHLGAHGGARLGA